jgi:hypothetical protein
LTLLSRYEQFSGAYRKQPMLTWATTELVKNLSDKKNQRLVKNDRLLISKYWFKGF